MNHLRNKRELLHYLIVMKNWKTKTSIGIIAQSKIVAKPKEIDNDQRWSHDSEKRTNTTEISLTVRTNLD